MKYRGYVELAQKLRDQELDNPLFGEAAEAIELLMDQLEVAELDASYWEAEYNMTSDCT